MGWMVIWWVFGAGLIAMVVWAFLRVGGGLRGSHESAEETLKRRYAGGEIDRDTYQRMVADLRSRPTHT
jgi:putative membrane protein